MIYVYTRRLVKWWKRCLLLSVATLILLQGLVGLKLVKVCGNSMASSFHDGEIVASITICDPTKVQRGDVVTFYPEKRGSMTYIKRIIALPGETIEAKENSVLVDGREISYWHGTGTWGPVTVPSNAVFVLGDNRAASCDSRSLGCIPFSQLCAKIIGKNVLLS